MKRLVLLLVAVAVLVAGGFYWKRSTSRAPQVAASAKRGPMGMPVKAGTVRAGRIVDEISAVGTLLANESVMIRPERDGRIA